MLRISKPEMIVLRDVLFGALKLPEMSEVVLKMDDQLEAFATGGASWKQIFLDVVVHFNNRSRIDEFVLFARQANDTDPALYDFARRYGLTTLLPKAADHAGVEALIRRRLGTLNAVEWFARGAAVGNCVGRLSDGDQPIGTAFLVGPGVALTNYHVVRRFIDEGADPATLSLRLDFMMNPDGGLDGAAPPVRLAPGAAWLIDHSELHPSDDPATHPEQPSNLREPVDVPPDLLDYALLRLDGRPGEATVGSTGRRRGWLRLSGDDHDFAYHGALLLFHFPEGRQLGFSLDTDSYAQANASGTRIFHRSNTEFGSSGSPCLDLDWNLVALHQGFNTFAGVRLNRAAPTSAIHALLVTRGKAGELGA